MPQRLRDTLALTHPELIGPNGEILLEKLRAEGAAPRGFFGDAVGGLVSKVFTLGRRARSATRSSTRAGTGEAAADAAAELGVTWAGTKALMWAIEKRLTSQPGLYRWAGASGEPHDLEPVDLRRRRRGRTTGDAAAARVRARHRVEHARQLRRPAQPATATCGPRWSGNYTGGIFAFEHRTLSRKPDRERAGSWRDALPDGAHVSLVSHSRGGLVADLLCLGDFDALIDNYSYAFAGTGDADPDEAERVLDELRRRARRAPRAAAQAGRDCCASGSWWCSATCAPPARRRARCSPAATSTCSCRACSR